MRACARRSIRSPAPKSPKRWSLWKRPTARRSEEITMELTRREFLKASAAVGGGLALEFSVAGSALAQAPAAAEVTHWIVVHPDDRVVIRVARSEMGQGSLTGLAQLVAEELDCDWNKVTAEFASPNEHI